MGLTQKDLCVIALFTGSDYTPGVHGIGMVNAVEIINCFGNSLDDMKRLRNWVDIKAQLEDLNIRKETQKEILEQEIEEAMED